jgi:hypothetical protein
VRTLVALSVLAIAGLAPSAAAPEADAKPRLILLDRSPVVVRGLRFKADERVQVSAIIRGRSRVTKSVVAGPGGVFKVRFASMRPAECAFLTVIANGARGSRASFTLHPPPCGAAP